MGAKQQWEAAQKTCETLGDMIVDAQTAAELRAVQTLLRRPMQAKAAREAYELASQARDALTQGDKDDARQLLARMRSLLDAPQSPASLQGKVSPAAEASAPEPAVPEKNSIPQKPSIMRRTSMAIFNKLRSTFGGERGKQASQNAMLNDKRAAIDRQISAWETQLASLQKERDALQAQLNEKVGQARTLDKTNPAYMRLRHEVMVIKPQIDTLSAQLTRLMSNIEKYAKVSAVYRSGQLNTETQLNERDLLEASVLVEQINDQIDVAADLDKELDAVLEKSDKVQQRILDQAAEQADSFFDSLVSGESAPAEAEDDPFAQLVAKANEKAAAETPAAPEKPEPAQPLEM